MVTSPVRLAPTRSWVGGPAVEVAGAYNGAPGAAQARPRLSGVASWPSCPAPGGSMLLHQLLDGGIRGHIRPQLDVRQLDACGSSPLRPAFGVFCRAARRASKVAIVSSSALRDGLILRGRQALLGPREVGLDVLQARLGLARAWPGPRRCPGPFTDSSRRASWRPRSPGGTRVASPRGRRCPGRGPRGTGRRSPRPRPAGPAAAPARTGTAASTTTTSTFSFSRRRLASASTAGRTGLPLRTRAAPPRARPPPRPPSAPPAVTTVEAGNGALPSLSTRFADRSFIFAPLAVLAQELQPERQVARAHGHGRGAQRIHLLRAAARARAFSFGSPRCCWGT